MKLLISADMEGVAGITHAVQTHRGSSEFARSCELMSEEVAAACAGALRAGADAVTVNDSHGDMRNIMPERLPAGVRLIQGSIKPWSMVQGVESSPDALAFIGYHAGAGSLHGILDHTYSGIVHCVELNGEPCSEARLNAAVAGSFGVPVVFLSGDQTACEEAQRIMPWIRTVEVKHALGRSAATSLLPQDACTEIEDAMAGTLASGLAGARLYTIPSPLTLDVTLSNTERTDNAALLPGAIRLDGTTVRYVADDIQTVFRAYRVLLSLGSSV